MSGLAIAFIYWYFTHVRDPGFIKKPNDIDFLVSIFELATDSLFDHIEPPTTH